MPYKDKEKQRAFQNAWKSNRREKTNAAKKLSRQERTLYIRNAKSGPCLDCGQSYDPCVMDFHHRENEIKIDSLGRAGNAEWSYQKIDEEIAKCDLLCANCHRLRHHKKQTSTGYSIDI